MLLPRCKNPECFDFATGDRARLTKRQNADRQQFCSVVCYGSFRRGRYTNGKNYIRIRIDGKRVYLHRFVMEQKLGRPLAPGEVVHHLDHNKFNNDENNLMLFSSQWAHLDYHRAHPYPEFINEAGEVERIAPLFYEAASAATADYYDFPF